MTAPQRYIEPIRRGRGGKAAGLGLEANREDVKRMREIFTGAPFRPSVSIGKPAFLRQLDLDVNTITDERGEELRDKFATAALTALLSHIHRSTAFAMRPDREAETVEHDKVAAEAYRWADAMLRARGQG